MSGTETGSVHGPEEGGGGSRAWPSAFGLVRLGRFLRLLVARFYGDRCLLHASALAYTSLLSLVPLLAVMFAVLKGLGVQQRLEPLLLSRLGLNQQVVDQIIHYIDRTNFGTLGALGAAMLVLTVLSVLGAVEASLNQIWRIAEGRTWLRKATDYLSVVLLTPFLLLAGVAITSSLESQSLLKWFLRTEYVGDAVLFGMRLAPVGINAVALGIVYAIMPNRRPRLLPLALGAVIAGSVWQVVQWTYVSMQIGVARYNAIYGALSQLPVTLVWLYVSWVVVLAGAEVAAAFEYGAEDEESLVSERALALHVLVRAAESFRDGRGPVRAPTLATELHVASTSVAKVCGALGRAGFLAAVAGEEGAFVLAREPAGIELAAVVGSVSREAIPARADARVQQEVEAVANRIGDPWRDRSLADLLGGDRVESAKGLG